MRDIIEATIRHSLRRALQSIYTSTKHYNILCEQLKGFHEILCLS